MSDLILQDDFTGNQRSTAAAKVLFGVAAGASFLLSVYLYFTGAREQGIFVGLWVPSILSAGTLVLSGRSKK